MNANGSATGAAGAISGPPEPASASPAPSEAAQPTATRERVTPAARREAARFFLNRRAVRTMGSASERLRLDPLRVGEHEHPNAPEDTNCVEKQLTTHFARKRHLLEVTLGYGGHGQSQDRP